MTKIEVNLDIATDEWYEANKDRYWRAKYKGANKFLFLIEDTLETAGYQITLDHFEQEPHNSQFRLRFSGDRITVKELSTLMNVVLVSNGKRFPFHGVEAVLYTEYDHNPYSDDNRYSESNYPRTAVLFNDSAD